jgi:hypothetical protein
LPASPAVLWGNLPAFQQRERWSQVFKISIKTCWTSMAVDPKERESKKERVSKSSHCHVEISENVLIVL